MAAGQGFAQPFLLVLRGSTNNSERHNPDLGSEVEKVDAERPIHENLVGASLRRS